MKNIVYKHTSIFILMLSMVFSLSSPMHENKKLTKKPVLSTAASTTSAATKTEPGSWDQLKSWIITSTAYSYLTLPFSPKYRIYSIASLCTGIAACFVIAQTGHSQEVTRINNVWRSEIFGGDDNKQDGELKIAREAVGQQNEDLKAGDACSICHFAYDHIVTTNDIMLFGVNIKGQKMNRPLQICTNGHHCCYDCVLFKDLKNGRKKCPTCDNPIQLKEFEDDKWPAVR